MLTTSNMFSTLVLVWFSFLLNKSLAACTFPSPFTSSTWQDSKRGTLTFTTTDLSGWNITVFNKIVISTWECVDNSSSTRLVMRTKTNIKLGFSGAAYYGYACLQLTKITENSYRYIQQQVVEPRAGQDRLYFHSNGSISDASTICNTSATIPTLEFQVLIKHGMGASAAITFPSKLLVSADYDYYAADGTVVCDGTKDKMDTCSNNHAELTFNYSSCAQRIANSDGGSFWCVATQPMDDYDCAVVFNKDAVTASYFACLCSDGHSVSIVPGNCTSYQTPTAFPMDADGMTTIGIKLLLPTVYAICNETESESVTIQFSTTDDHCAETEPESGTMQIFCLRIVPCVMGASLICNFSVLKLIL